jgi:hypothetical protein
MSNDAQLCAGYEIRSYPKRLAGTDAAYVTLHRLGDGGRGFLTAFEAKSLAALLIKAAQEIEAKL